MRPDALGDPAVRQRLEDLGQVIPPREQQRQRRWVIPQSRGKEMVADRQSSEHQTKMK
jgi:hypothetical protein